MEWLSKLRDRSFCIFHVKALSAIVILKSFAKGKIMVHHAGHAVILLELRKII